MKHVLYLLDGLVYLVQRENPVGYLVTDGLSTFHLQRSNCVEL